MQLQREGGDGMDLGALPLLVLIAPGLVGFTLMIVAFVMVARQGGWTPAMQPDPQGRWPLPRRLMCAGAGLGVLFAVICLILYFRVFRG
jgi:hypothetical protein